MKLNLQNEKYILAEITKQPTFNSTSISQPPSTPTIASNHQKSPQTLQTWEKVQSNTTLTTSQQLFLERESGDLKLYGGAECKTACWPIVLNLGKWRISAATHLCVTCSVGLLRCSVKLFPEIKYNK